MEKTIYDYIEQINLVKVEELPIEKINVIIDKYKEEPSDRLYEDSKSLKGLVEKEIKDYEAVHAKIKLLQEEMLANEEISDEDKTNCNVIMDNLLGQFTINTDNARSKLNIIKNLLMNHKMRMLTYTLKGGNKISKAKKELVKYVGELITIFILTGFYGFSGYLLFSVGTTLFTTIVGTAQILMTILITTIIISATLTRIETPKEK